VSLEKRLCLLCLLFVQRQKNLCTAALKGPFLVGCVRQKVFQRGKQKLTKPAFLSIGTGVNFMFEHVGEETLREILCVVHSVSATAYETV